MSHIPEFEGDDLRRLANEINKAKQFLKQCITFSKMYDKRENLTEGMFVCDFSVNNFFAAFKKYTLCFIFKEVVIGPIHINEVKDHQVRHKGCVPVDFLM